VPYLSPVIEIFKQLCRYTEAEITAAVISGMLAMVVTSPAPVSRSCSCGDRPSLAGASQPHCMRSGASCVEVQR
jgi:capsid protein